LSAEKTDVKTSDELSGLPAPVYRYIERTNRPGKPGIAGIPFQRGRGGGRRLYGKRWRRV